MSADLEAKSVVDQTGEKENVTENVLPIRTEPLGIGRAVVPTSPKAYQDAQQLMAQGGQLYPSIMGAPIQAYASLGDVGEQQRALMYNHPIGEPAHRGFESGTTLGVPHGRPKQERGQECH